MEQYSKPNCMLFHGINTSENESTDEKIKEFDKAYFTYTWVFDTLI